VDKCLGNVELKAIKTMEQPILDQRNNKSTKTLTPIEILLQTKGNELNKPFIRFFYFFFISFFFSLFFIFIFLKFHSFLSSFFSCFFINENKNIKRLNFMN